jgi:hypothetical protein
VPVCHLTPVYVNLCQFMLSYVSLRQFMPVYVILCQFMLSYDSLRQFMPVCFTSCHLYQLMSVDVSLSVCYFLSVFQFLLHSPFPFLSALTNLYKHSCPLLIATHSASSLAYLYFSHLKVCFQSVALSRLLCWCHWITTYFVFRCTQ